MSLFCKKDCQTKRSLYDGIVARDELIKSLTKENNKLRAALKPVLEVDCSSHMFGRILIAVEASQKIYHDGEK